MVTGFFTWLRKTWAAHGLWATAMSVLVVLPAWQYLRSQKILSETTLGSLLPFSAEAWAEASDSPFGLHQARVNHAAILALYIRSLDRSDIMSYLNVGRPAALRAELISIAKELEDVRSEPNDREAIKRAARKTYELYQQFETPTLGLPTINRGKDGAVLVAVNVFCTTSELFEHTMKLDQASSSRKADMCELACLDSRRAFLVILSRWFEYGEKDRSEIIGRFVHCQSRTYDLTKHLADEMSTSDMAKASTLNSYAKSMNRRLQTIDAMKSGDYAKAIELLQEPISQRGVSDSSAR